VRTFLDFRAGTNRGMRKSLLTEPEQFFAYNNGITVTATAVETKQEEGQLFITSMDNMQIVNGGQTTAAIYFSPREKGGIKSADGIHNYSNIDLSKVYVQMKLTVIEDKQIADVMKANIATFANSQNSIQQSDLISNHPFHLNIETRSRKQLMPAGESGLSSKWFYERVRGQYSTQLRALNGRQRGKFEAEYPKKHVFTKTDMAKYENTWRMKPYMVKKGAQANLKALGGEIIKEFDQDEGAFGPVFYNDLVAKMLLFRKVDTAILQASWYKAEKGLKAEIVTYSIALLRYTLLQSKKDINLSTIFESQCVSESLLNTIVSIAYIVRNNITDFEFTGGVTNPSEFTKSEKGWLRCQQIQVNLDGLDEKDILFGNQVDEASQERKAVIEVSKSISLLDQVMNFTSKEWEFISAFNGQTYPYTHKNVSVPNSCVALINHGKLPTDRQLKMALEIRNKAYEEGFDFID
jgi:hypothetical protein